MRVKLWCSRASALGGGGGGGEGDCPAPKSVSVSLVHSHTHIYTHIHTHLKGNLKTFVQNQGKKNTQQIRESAESKGRKGLEYKAHRKHPTNEEPDTTPNVECVSAVKPSKSSLKPTKDDTMDPLTPWGLP